VTAADSSAGVTGPDSPPGATDRRDSPDSPAGTASEGGPTHEPVVRARDVVGAAAGIYRRHFVTLAAMSLLVFSVLAVLDALAREAVTPDGGAVTLPALAAWLLTGLWMFGSALFAGLCDTVVSTAFGHREPPLRLAWRRLPYGRLLVLDVVLTVSVSAGLALLVVPGVLVFALTCIAAPLVVLEGLDVRAALVRSARLVRPRLGLAVLVVVLPVLIEHELHHAVGALVGLSPLVAFGLRLLGIVAVLAPVTLCEVVLAHGLTGRPMVVVADAPRLAAG
jgi:hypothetical protein